MDYRDLIDKSVPNLNPITIAFGPTGVGKTTFAISAPDPLLFTIEPYTIRKKVERLPGKSYQQILDLTDQIIQNPAGYKTVIYDSIDWLEPLIIEHVCKIGNQPNLDSFGYGKGYNLVVAEWIKFKSKLLLLREQMNVTLIGHSIVKPLNDPMHPSTDRHQIKLNEKWGGIVKEVSDSILFMTNHMYTKKEGLKTRGYSDGERIMYTEWRAFHDGKNRFGLEYEMPLSWDAYAEAIENPEEETAEKVRESILAMIINNTNTTFVETVHKRIKTDDVEKLKKTRTQVETKLQGDLHA